MPFIKYRINNETTNEIMIDSNMTVSNFINLINKESKEKVTKSIIRGRTLDDNDLIRNHIATPEDVLILVSDQEEHKEDMIELDQDHKENKDIKAIEDSVSSSLFFRKRNNLIRNGNRYTFTIYTTATADSMINGTKHDFFLNAEYYTVHDKIKEMVSNFPQVDYLFSLHIFLAGGVYFKTGKILDYYTDPSHISFDNIYVIVIKEPNEPHPIEEEIEEPCCCSNPQQKEILSPFCESTNSGLTQIATFLGYMFHGGLKSEHILLSIAKITRFAPLVVNLYRLMRNKPLNVLNILCITSSIFTLFRSMLPEKIKNENIYEYTLKILSILDVISNTEYLKFIEIDMNNEQDKKTMKEFVKYYKEQDNQQHVIIWTADTINPNFQSLVMERNPFEMIDNIFSTVTTFKPVAPLSLHYIFYPTFIRGKDENSVMLFIKEVQDKDSVISIIDPNEGREKEINIEELAHQINCDKKEDIFTLIEPNQVDQIIFICFDESTSMKWLLKGGNPHHGEMTREQHACEFLKALVKQSYALRVSSFYGLITFSSDVKIRQPLTAMSSKFIQSLDEINPRGKTLLYDAINTAQHEILKLTKGEDGKSRYPNSRSRIIVITDGTDNKSETKPEALTNDLIRNDIVVDTVLVSLVDDSSGCCAISKLTGGLCFMPRNYEEGIKIFEQEAFLNIKVRHMNPLPYDNITEDNFDDEITKFKQNNRFDQYSPNQMIINAKTQVDLASPMYMSFISKRKQIKTYRMTCTLTELNIIGKNPNENYVVYSLLATPEEWRIFIKGPKNTPFSDKWLNLYMVIPPKYPNEPPHFRFITIPFHPNISSEGKVVFSLNDKDYKSSIGIDSIITGIINLLENPDVNYNINQQAMELFKNDKKEFTNMQEKGETGVKDYHEYINKVKIFDEIPKNAYVPKKERNQSNLVSITMESINKAAMNGSNVKDQCLLDINDYEIMRTHGSGGFGTVYLVKEKKNNFEFAAKVPRKDINEGIDYIKLVNVMSLFNHAAIVKIYGYCLKDFDGKDNHVIIMENVSNGDLKSCIKDEKNGNPKEHWDDTQKLIILYGIASGMAYSIAHEIAHSDLKPENVLMTDELYPKITDFDTARLKSEGFNQSFNRSNSDICSPLYTAPEFSGGEYSEKSDVYSFAIVTYEVITGLTPFASQKINIFQLSQRVEKGERPQIPKSVPQQYSDLMNACWNGDPEKRPTFQEIVEILSSNAFLTGLNIDEERFKYYINYVNNYANAVTVSQLVRPLSRAEKRKPQSSEIDNNDLTRSDFVKILNLKDYRKETPLGAGRYSEVVKIVEKETGEAFAAKISFNKTSREVNRKVLSEVKIMMQLDHPAILKFIGYSSVDFENISRPTIIIEYASKGSLQNVIDKDIKSGISELSDTKKLIVIFGIASGMSYLHEHNILHNDLKPSNILLDDNFHPKIADFGLADIKNDNFSGSNSSFNIKGTASYIAPEIWDEQSYSEASDMYSFGILLYEMVFNTKAFAGIKPIIVGGRVAGGERPSFPSKNEFNSLIMRCWAQDPKERPTFKELITELQDEKYISENVDRNEYIEYVKSINNSKC